MPKMNQVAPEVHVIGASNRVRWVNYSRKQPKMQTLALRYFMPPHFLQGAGRTVLSCCVSQKLLHLGGNAVKLAGEAIDCLLEKTPGRLWRARVVHTEDKCRLHANVYSFHYGGRAVESAGVQASIGGLERWQTRRQHNDMRLQL